MKHLNLHDNNLERCYFCPWGTPRNQTHNVSTHLNQHLGKPNYKCPMCDRAFYRKILLDYHFEIYHEKIEGKYSCNFCSYKTHSRDCLFKHTGIVHKKTVLTPRLSAWPLRGHRVLKSILEDILQPTKSKMSPT